MLSEDWSVDVKKYVPDADDGIIAGIVRYCGIALRKVDSSLVAFSDPKETARVRDGYCRKKLGLTESDAEVDAAIAAVGERMKADRTKNRVTVYYLLAEHFGKLGLFAGKAKAGSAGAAAAGAAVAATAVGAAAASAAPVTAAKPVAAPAPEPVMAAPPPAPAPTPAPEPVAAAPVGLVGAAAATGAAAAATAATAQTGDSDRQGAAGAGWTQPVGREPGGGFMFGTALAVVGLIIGAALIAWLISSRMGGSPDAAAPAVVAAAPAPAAPVEPVPAPTPPEGAGVVATEVAGRPMVSVYFDSASALIASDFATVTAPIKAWLDAHPEDMAQVSGFNDPRGNAEFNADLSRRRAEGVAAELRRMGVPDNQIDLEPPAAATDTTTDLAGARRVEITVVPLS